MIISIISMKINPKKTKQPNKVIKFYLDTVARLHLCWEMRLGMVLGNV